MKHFDVGVLGATTPVGAAVLRSLSVSAKTVAAFSRSRPVAPEVSCLSDEWLRLGTPDILIGSWVCLAPLWVLPSYFDWLVSCGVRRIVVLSSTSRFAKENSPDLGERQLASALAVAENSIQEWASLHGIEWIVLRPTLIYGSGRDKNVASIMRFVSRWKFFPLAGRASGLRQPVHYEDVAQACLAVLSSSCCNRAYTLSGAECLSFRALVERSAVAVGVRPWLPSIPIVLVRAGLSLVAFFRPGLGWSSGMADRMNRDQVFDYFDAAKDFGFCPRVFLPTRIESFRA